MKPLLKSFALAGVLLATACSGIKSPEKSKLFEPFVDPESGVVSYVLKYGAPDDNRQSTYFISKSMTNDGRFLIFWYNQGNEKKEGGIGERHLMLADLKSDSVHDLGMVPMTPFVEINEDYMVYGDREKGFFRVDFAKPAEQVKLCDIPQELS